MVLPGPTTWQHYIEQILGWRFWTTFPVAITKHALGTMRHQDSWYIPKADLPRIHNEARFMIVVYGTVAAIARSEEDFGLLTHSRDWELKTADPAQWVWTDDYSNIVGAVLRKLNE